VAPVSFGPIRGRGRESIVLLIVAVAAMLALPGVAAGQEDTTPPTLTALSCSPSAVDVTGGPQTVTCTATITDDLSGVADNSSRITLQSPSEIQGATGFFTHTSGDEYEAQVTIPQYAEAGTWRPHSQCGAIQLVDQAGNRVCFDNAELQTMGFNIAVEVRHGQIAFASRRTGNGDIYSMNADGSAQTRLTTHPTIDGFPALSATGKRIAFASNRDGNLEIYSMNANGGALTRLTTNPAADSSPSWAPDGRRIAFASKRTANGDIYLIDGSARTRLTSGPAVDGEPSWSPDGTKIAFTSSRTGNGDIYVMNANGSALTRLTTHPAADSSPAWSPDGRRIAFASKRTGNGDIYVTKGSARTRLTTGPAVDGEPAFLRDGRIAFTSKRTANGDVYLMNANGMAQTRLTTNPSLDSSPDAP
jgi:Tol biopolymer transport system component